MYIILQLPMRKSSRNVVLINTSPPQRRVELLKPLSEIEVMSDDCEEIHSGGLLKRYTKWPDCLQNITLAYWAAWYDSCGQSQYKKALKTSDIDQLPLEDQDGKNDNELCDENTETSVSSINTIKKRSVTRIIQTWQNVQNDLMGNYSSFQEHYVARHDEITKQMRQYAACSEDLDEIQHHLQQCDDDLYDTIAPVTQHAERCDQDEGMSEDLGIPSSLPNNEPLILNEMQDGEYRAFVQMLNKKQREFFYHTLHLMKRSDKPFYTFLSGAGGVEKSHLIKSIYQAALKYYNAKAGDDFHRVHALLLAPTGKAAYLIKGNTIHSALAIPASQLLKNYRPLACKQHVYHSIE